MKTQILRLILFSGLLSGILFGCNDNFMDGKPGKDGLIIAYPDTVYGYAKVLQKSLFELNIPEAGNSQYSVIAMPEWVTGSGYTPRFVNGKAEINVSIRESSQKLTGALLLSIETMGLVKINLELMPVGTPVANSMGTIPIEGTVSDAKYYKPADCLFMVTQNPNRLLIYSVAFGMKKLELSRRPNCLVISEDGRTVVVGQGGMISVVDVATTSVSKQFYVDGDVFDLALGENGYCYFVLNNDSWFYSLDMESGKLSSGYFSGVNSQSYLTKIKGQPAILVSSNWNMLALIDISVKVPEQGKSWRLDFWPGSRAWTTENGEFFVVNEGQIIQTPAFNSGNYIYVAATLGNNNVNYRQWVDHCAESQRFYAVESSRYGEEPGIPVVSYLDNGTYKQDQTYEYSEYVMESGGSKSVYANQARYVFAKKNGSELFLIKNTVPEEIWCVEKLKIK